MASSNVVPEVASSRHEGLASKRNSVYCSPLQIDVIEGGSTALLAIAYFRAPSEATSMDSSDQAAQP